MEIRKSEFFSVLQEFNPWWSAQPVADLPDWERAASRQIRAWIDDRETKRALLLTGARQAGKTTLFRQAIGKLVTEGFPRLV
jgi:predicted AAA+ superfamily ATPase